MDMTYSDILQKLRSLSLAGIRTLKSIRSATLPNMMKCNMLCITPNSQDTHQPDPSQRLQLYVEDPSEKR
jgi:hypothetical protein